MKIILIGVAIVFAFGSVNAQERALDKYLNEAGTIVIAKCLSVGPVNILLRANVRVQVLLVVKGAETQREMTVNSQYGMVEGETYLLKTKNTSSSGDAYFRIDSRDAVIPVSTNEKMAELKALSPRIIVLRTMNLRSYDIERQISTLKYELEAIDAVRNDN